MYIKAMGVVLALASCNAFANDEWIVVGETDDKKLVYEAKGTSWKMAKNKSGKLTSSIIGRVKVASEKSVEFQSWHVTIDDCNRGMGKLTTLTINGDPNFETDFVIDGGNIASSIASTLCEIAKVASKQR